jgi:hypothetical protein
MPFEQQRNRFPLTRYVSGLADLHRSLRLKRASSGQSHFGNFRQTIKKGRSKPVGDLTWRVGVVITENDLEQARCEQTA